MSVTQFSITMRAAPLESLALCQFPRCEGNAKWYVTLLVVEDGQEDREQIFSCAVHAIYSAFTSICAMDERV